MATVYPTLNFWGVLSESKRIINAHSRHFLALSVLFLLPLSFSLIIYPTLLSLLSPSIHHTPTLLNHHHHLHTQTLIFPLLFTLFLLLLSVSAVATVTYSTYHGFFGRPVKLISAVKSLVSSFLPLIATSLASLFLILIILSLFGLSSVLLLKGIENFLGCEIDYGSNYYFLGFCVVVSVVLVFVLVRLELNWALASVIVVVESKWGFEPLRRSTELVKGMRSVSLSLVLFFGALIGLSVWFWSVPTSLSSSSFRDVWNCLSFIMQMVTGTSLLMMFMLHNLAANTVFYMYCKAMRGELALEIAEEFAREYVSLPFDDAKVPHVVYVVEA